jgi:hypothetical protein
MAIQYDPSVLEEYADRLYNRANRVVVLCAALGFLGGVVAATILAAVVVWRSPRAEPPGGWLLLSLPVGLALGWAYGRDKTFQLRLEAQRTLCQLQIEHNTRGRVSAAGATPTQALQQVTCPKCAKSFPAGSKFCPDCGTPLPGAPPSLARASE